MIRGRMLGLSIALAAIFSAGEPPVWAQAQPPAASSQRLLAFDIPSQPLSSAIEAYAAVTGVQVLYDRPTGEEPRSPGVHGLFTAAGALTRLLAGVGLAARFQDANDVVLERPGGAPRATAAPERPPGPPPGMPSLALDTLQVQAPPMVEGPPAGFDPALYRALIQGEIQHALSLDPQTAAGAYVAVLKLWILPTGALRTVEIAVSTGDAKRDRAIGRVLTGLPLHSAMPAEMPQPVIVRIDARSMRH
jgi:hypothetical protein